MVIRDESVVTLVVLFIVFVAFILYGAHDIQKHIDAQKIQIQNLEKLLEQAENKKQLNRAL